MPPEDSAIRSHAQPLLARGAYPLLLAGAFLVYAAANAPVPVATELRSAAGLDGSDAALFLLPFAVGFGAGTLAWLAVARHRAPRAVLPASLGLMAAATVPALLVPAPAATVASRVAVGLAAAGYPAVAQSAITRAAAPGRRGRLIGGFVMAVVAGSFVGQALVGGLAQMAGARAALATVCVAAPLAAAALLWRSLSRSPAAGRPEAAAPGAGEGIARVVRRQWPVLTVALLGFGGYWLLLSRLPVALRDERFHLTAAEAGALPAIGLLGVATAWFAGRAADRVGQRLPMTVTLATGIAGLAVTLPAGTPLWAFAAGYGVFLAAYWGYLPPASAEVAARSTAHDRQPALMALYAAMWTGAAVAPALGAALHGWTAAALAAGAAWAIAAAVAATTFTAPRRTLSLVPRSEGAP